LAALRAGNEPGQNFQPVLQGRHLALGISMYSVGIGSEAHLLFLRGKKALCYRVHALAGSGSPCLMLAAKLDPLSLPNRKLFSLLFGLGFTDENKRYYIAQPRGMAPSHQALINHAAFVCQKKKKNQCSILAAQIVIINVQKTI